MAKPPQDEEARRSEVRAIAGSVAAGLCTKVAKDDGDLRTDAETIADRALAIAWAIYNRVDTAMPS